MSISGLGLRIRFLAALAVMGVVCPAMVSAVVVQFTEYRRSIGEKGEPLFHWVGQAKLLKQPEEMTVSATPLPERFELLLIGEDGREEVRALKSLELMLSKTLRPRARKPAKEAI